MIIAEQENLVAQVLHRCGIVAALPVLFINLVADDIPITRPDPTLVKVIGRVKLPDIELRYLTDEGGVPRVIPKYPYTQWDQPPHFEDPALREGKRCMEILREHAQN